MNMSINIYFCAIFDADSVFLYNLTSKGHFEVIWSHLRVIGWKILKKFNTNQTQSHGGFYQRFIVIEQDVLFSTRRFLTAVKQRNQAVIRGKMR